MEIVQHRWFEGVSLLLEIGSSTWRRSRGVASSLAHETKYLIFTISDHLVIPSSNLHNKQQKIISFFIKPNNNN